MCGAGLWDFASYQWKRSKQGKTVKACAISHSFVMQRTEEVTVNSFRAQSQSVQSISSRGTKPAGRLRILRLSHAHAP